MPRPHLTPWKDPVPIVQEAWRAPWPVWTGAENLASTGIRSPDRPARGQSLYRLRYPAPSQICNPSKHSGNDNSRLLYLETRTPTPTPHPQFLCLFTLFSHNIDRSVLVMDTAGVYCKVGFKYYLGI